MLVASGRFLKRPHRAYCGLVFFVSLISAISGACAESTAINADRTYIGTEVCSRCHVLETEHWNNTVHAKVFKHGARSDLESKGCEACHGPGSAHIADVTDPDAIISFTRGATTDVRAQNAVCRTCHEGGPLFHWLGSTHEAQDLSCADCHNPMSKMSPNALLRESSVNETCFVCHAEQRLQFRKRTHMPLLEGKMTCVDCHNPHGSATDPLLKADSTNQLCYTCHAEKRGRFCGNTLRLRRIVSRATKLTVRIAKRYSTIRRRFCVSSVTCR